MQIREQGRQVQLIRSPYDKDKKRCVQKVVHTFQQLHSYPTHDITKYLSAAQVADLSADERKTLSGWLLAKADKELAVARRHAIDYVDRQMNNAVDAISADVLSVSAERAAAIWESIEKLSKTLKRAGHPKSGAKAPGPPQVAGDPAQTDRQS